MDRGVCDIYYGLNKSVCKTFKFVAATKVINNWNKKANIIYIVRY